MNFKEYDKFISEHKFDMLFMIIYYNLKCNELSESLTDGELETLITKSQKAGIKVETIIGDSAYSEKGNIKFANKNNMKQNILLFINPPLYKTQCFIINQLYNSLF